MVGPFLCRSRFRCCHFGEGISYPIDNLKALADAKIPIPHVVGSKDRAVPVAENTAVAETRYKGMGGGFEVIHKNEGRHHPHSLKDPTSIVEFIGDHVENKQR